MIMAASTTKVISVDDWKAVQTVLNRLKLVNPPLDVDGDPGPLTLAAGEALVAAIKKAMSEHKPPFPTPTPMPA